jgi:hypothetical protein
MDWRDAGFHLGQSGTDLAPGQPAMWFSSADNSPKQVSKPLLLIGPEKRPSHTDLAQNFPPHGFA